MKKEELLEYKRLLSSYYNDHEDYVLVGTNNTLKNKKKYEIREEKSTDRIVELLSNQFILGIDQLYKQDINYKGLAMELNVYIITKKDNVKNNKVISWDKVNKHLVYVEVEGFCYSKEIPYAKQNDYYNEQYIKNSATIENFDSEYFLNLETFNNSFKKRGFYCKLDLETIKSMIENENVITPLVWLIVNKELKKDEKKKEKVKKIKS